MEPKKAQNVLKMLNTISGVQNEQESGPSNNQRRERPEKYEILKQETTTPKQQKPELEPIDYYTLKKQLEEALGHKLHNPEILRILEKEILEKTKQPNELQNWITEVERKSTIPSNDKRKLLDQAIVLDKQYSNITKTIESLKTSNFPTENNENNPYLNQVDAEQLIMKTGIQSKPSLEETKEILTRMETFITGRLKSLKTLQTEIQKGLLDLSRLYADPKSSDSLKPKLFLLQFIQDQLKQNQDDSKLKRITEWINKAKTNKDEFLQANDLESKWSDLKKVIRKEFSVLNALNLIKQVENDYKTLINGKTSWNDYYESIKNFLETHPIISDTTASGKKKHLEELIGKKFPHIFEVVLHLIEEQLKKLSQEEDTLKSELSEWINIIEEDSLSLLKSLTNSKNKLIKEAKDIEKLYVANDTKQRELFEEFPDKKSLYSKIESEMQSYVTSRKLELTLNYYEGFAQNADKILKKYSATLNQSKINTIIESEFNKRLDNLKETGNGIINPGLFLTYKILIDLKQQKDEKKYDWMSKQPTKSDLKAVEDIKNRWEKLQELIKGYYVDSDSNSILGNIEQLYIEQLYSDTFANIKSFLDYKTTVIAFLNKQVTEYETAIKQAKAINQAEEIKQAKEIEKESAIKQAEEAEGIEKARATGRESIEKLCSDEKKQTEAALSQLEDKQRQIEELKKQVEDLKNGTQPAIKASHAIQATNARKPLQIPDASSIIDLDMTGFLKVLEPQSTETQVTGDMILKAIKRCRSKSSSKEIFTKFEGKDKLNIETLIDAQIVDTHLRVYKMLFGDVNDADLIEIKEDAVSCDVNSPSKNVSHPFKANIELNLKILFFNQDFEKILIAQRFSILNMIGALDSTFDENSFLNDINKIDEMFLDKYGLLLSNKKICESLAGQPVPQQPVEMRVDAPKVDCPSEEDINKLLELANKVGQEQAENGIIKQIQIRANASVTLDQKANETFEIQLDTFNDNLKRNNTKTEEPLNKLIVDLKKKLDGQGHGEHQNSLSLQYVQNEKMGDIVTDLIKLEHNRADLVTLEEVKKIINGTDTALPLKDTLTKMTKVDDIVKDLCNALKDLQGKLANKDAELTELKEKETAHARALAELKEKETAHEKDLQRMTDVHARALEDKEKALAELKEKETAHARALADLQKMNAECETKLNGMKHPETFIEYLKTQYKAKSVNGGKPEETKDIRGNITARQLLQYLNNILETIVENGTKIPSITLENLKSEAGIFDALIKSGKINRDNDERLVDHIIKIINALKDLDTEKVQETIKTKKQTLEISQKQLKENNQNVAEIKKQIQNIELLPPKEKGEKKGNLQKEKTALDIKYNNENPKLKDQIVRLESEIQELETQIKRITKIESNSFNQKGFSYDHIAKVYFQTGITEKGTKDSFIPFPKEKP